MESITARDKATQKEDQRKAENAVKSEERTRKENRMAEFSYPNINSVDVDDDVIKEYVQANFSPDDVFPESELESWAESNGFARE